MLLLFWGTWHPRIWADLLVIMQRRIAFVLDESNHLFTDYCLVNFNISDKRLPKRENLDFQISCLYLGLPEVFFSFLIYLSILIKAKTFTNDFVEWFALWCYKSTCYGNCANPHHLLIIISRWFWHDLVIYAELWHPWPAKHHENH